MPRTAGDPRELEQSRPASAEISGQEPTALPCGLSRKHASIQQGSESARSTLAGSNHPTPPSSQVKFRFAGLGHPGISSRAL